MVLRMARPHRDKTTGIYSFRQRVPVALQDVVGRDMVKISLRTRDPNVAKIEHARVAAEVAERWARLADGPCKLSHMETEGVVGEIYRSMIEAHEDDPDKVPGRLIGLLGDRLLTGAPDIRLFPGTMDEATAKTMIERLRKSRNEARVSAWLQDKGLLLTDESRAAVAAAVDRVVLQAREQLEKMAGGDYRPDPDATRFPKLDLDSKRRAAIEAGKRGTLKVFDDYAKNHELSESSLRRWRPIIEKVADEIPDLGNITPDWVVDWKDRLIEQGIGKRTVRDVHLTALRSMCSWAVTNRRIPVNPASGISQRVKKRPKLRERGYTDEEACKILLAAQGPQPKRLSPHYRRARRWVPWICAYTGARVGEIAQLRKCDIQPRGKAWIIRITPEAGTVKTNEARTVPVHAALLDQGFLDFVQAAAEGPLFYDPKLSKGGKMPLADRVGGHLSTWVRQDVKITDPEIQPNHAWRHRLKTLSRICDMREDATRYIQGHAPHAKDERYGDHNPAPLVREISKLPVLNLDPDPSNGEACESEERANGTVAVSRPPESGPQDYE